MTPWPLVTEEDMCPGGAPGKCCHCSGRLGQEHDRECPTVRRKVRVRYSYELEIEVPHYHTAHMVEFSRNDAHWCASNGIQELEDFYDSEAVEYCPCVGFRCEYLGEVEDSLADDA